MEIWSHRAFDFMTCRWTRFPLKLSLKLSWTTVVICPGAQGPSLAETSASTVCTLEFKVSIRPGVSFGGRGITNAYSKAFQTPRYLLVDSDIDLLHAIVPNTFSTVGESIESFELSSYRELIALLERD
jgi:hypothetical protein